MSQLDNILKELEQTGEAYGMNVGSFEGLLTKEEAKDQIKTLFKELVGESEPEKAFSSNPTESIIPMGRNDLRAELRERIEKL